MDVEPVVSLAGRVSEGKAFTNIAHNSGIKYNSGIYKIVGLNIRLRKIADNGRGYLYVVGDIKGFPSIDVTSRNALFALGKDGLCFFYPNKNNLKNYITTVFEYGDLQFMKTETKSGWGLIED